MSAVPSKIRHQVTAGALPPKPQPDKAAMLAALNALFDPSDVVELRSIARGTKFVDAGYFDGEHREALVEAAARLNRNGAAAYLTMNRIDPQLLGRYCNRVQARAPDTATDANVLWRRWLLIDLDPTRPKNTAATDAQVEAAKNRAVACCRMLKAKGWPEPLVGESGNGWHLLYPLDLPNDADSTALVKGALAGIAAAIDDEAVKVDQSVFNAARITKAYGTVSTKGDHTPTAPWRLSRLVTTPVRVDVVKPDQLRALHPAKTEQALPAPTKQGQVGFDLAGFLVRLGIGYERDDHDGRERYKLEHCPFNEAHGKGEAAILRWANGKLGFKCQHDSCTGKHWQDVRELLDGPRASRPSVATELAATTENGAGRRGGGSDSDRDNFAAISWPALKPIVQELSSAPLFDAKALLPRVLADYVLDEADRMPCPPDYIASALMVAIGSVIGSRCALKPKRRDDWIVTPNLFGGAVGDPGVAKKTPSTDKGVRFLDRLEADESDRLVHRTVEYEAEVAAHKAREAAIAAIMKQAAGGKNKAENSAAMEAAMDDMKLLKPPEEPHARRFRTNDATVEKLGDILAKSPEGILVFRDELVGLLSSWEREGRESDRAFYLEGWNGLGSFAIDRIGRGSLLVRTLNLSVYGCIQPDLLSRYLAGIVDSSDNDGRIQRFQMLVYPDAVYWEWRDRYPVQGTRERVRDMFLRLAAFDPVQDGATPADDFVKVPHFGFDDAAQEVFIEWSGDLHHNMIVAETNPLLRQHFAKYEKLFCSVALILHLAEGRIGPIQADTTLRAAAWTQYLAGHARRVYGLLDAAKVGAAQTLANRIAAGKLPDGFTAREVQRKCWTGLGTLHQVDSALGILEEFGHVVGIDSSETPGRPTTRYWVNPSIQQRAAP